MTANQLVLIGKVNCHLSCRKIDGASASQTGLKVVQNYVNQHNLNPNESFKIQFCNDFLKNITSKMHFRHSKFFKKCEAHYAVAYKIIIKTMNRLK